MIEPFKSNYPDAELVPLVAKLNEVIEAVNNILEVLLRLEAWGLSAAARIDIEAR